MSRTPDVVKVNDWYGAFASSRQEEVLCRIGALYELAKVAGEVCGTVCLHFTSHWADTEVMHNRLLFFNHLESPAIFRARSATPLTPDLARALPFMVDKTVSRNLMIHKDQPADISRTKAYYNPARSTVYSRYSPADWCLSNKMFFNLSDKERSFAERLRSDAWRAVKETDARTRNRQKDVTRKLCERVSDISLWKGELSSEISNMANETENLKEYKRMLDRAFNDTNNPLHIAEECLMHREKRFGIDLVHDDVEKSLVKEVDGIKKCQEKMKRLLEKAHAQLRLNRSTQHILEIDAKDKCHAQNIDDRLQHFRNTSAGIGYYPGIESIDNTVSIPQSWCHYTQGNILNSQKERLNSEQLRGEIDACLRACANNMWNQFNTVNNTFNARIREMTDTRNKLQKHLQKTMQEIFDMEKGIDQLRRAIQDKEGPMKVAQTRLEERTHRLSVELCNDQVMRSLQCEVNEIRDSVRILKDKLRMSEVSLARLVKTKAALERDVSIKENSLSIDSKYCMGMRKSFPMDPKIGPIFQMPLSC